jgi:hypothetical protein
MRRGHITQHSGIKKGENGVRDQETKMFKNEACNYKVIKDCLIT